MRKFRVPLLLLFVAAALYFKLWLAPDGFLYQPNNSFSDLTITHWPNAWFIRDSLKAWGQIPLWRPLILGGEPFAANPLSGLWYPPYWLLLFLPLTPTFHLLFVLHTGWAGLGSYRLARATGSSRAGGLVAAFTVMIAPKAVAHLAAGHVGLICAWAWLPWVLWAVRRLAERARPGDAAAAAAAGGMLILADVRLGFYGGLATAGYWLTMVARGAGRPAGTATSRGHAVLRWFWPSVALLLVVGLAAVQWVPLAAVAGRLNRGGMSLEESGVNSLPPQYLVGLLIADHGGFHEWMTYVGAVSLLLALVAVIRWRQWERWWWTGVALAALIYSLGTFTPLYGILHGILPPLGWLRGPSRAWFLVVQAVAVLAAHGLSALEAAKGRRGRRADLAAVGLAGMAISGGAGGLFLRLPANLTVAAVIWPLAGLLLTLRAGRRLSGSRFVALVLALMLVDLNGVADTLYRVRPADHVLAEGEAAAAWLASQPGFFRVYSPSYSIPQQTGAAYGLEMVDGVDPFQLADYVAFMRAATGVDIAGYSVTVPSFPEHLPPEELLMAHQDVTPDQRLLGLLNVRYLAASYPLDLASWVPLGTKDGVFLYRNEQALPRAFVVERVFAVDGLAAALDWLAVNHPAEAAVVDGGLPLEGDSGLREAVIVDWTPNRITVMAEGPGLLIVSEVYDPDWYAVIDGRPVEIVRADGILRGVYLEEGRHQVAYTYRPAGLRTGCVVTVVAWLCLLGLWVADLKYRT